MDLDSFFSSVNVAAVFLITAISLLFLKIVLKATWRSCSQKLPPGPWRLPVIGSVHHLAGALPHHRFRELSRKYGAVMWLQLGETPTVVVSSAEAAKEVLRTHDVIFAQRPHLPAADVVLYGSTNITFSPVGDHWKLLRKICSLEMVNAKRVRSFQPLREKEVSSLVTQLSEQARSSSLVNLSEKIYTTIFDITSKAAFGENYKSRDELFFISEIMLKSSESRSICDIFPSQNWLAVISGMKRKWETMHRMADTVLEKITSGVGATSSKVVGGEADCLLSALLNAKEDGSLTSDNVKAVMLVIT
ncbi:cytochrome P450 71D11-like [Neltuma alba]|uniref:cytochrome P450 71D11-like n=1 Tax=Neltuma alba TaxID=207710 RepID=UPI0010A411B7|nr:cytochrome P450 71D11-like [Prosopis alba]